MSEDDVQRQADPKETLRKNCHVDGVGKSLAISIHKHVVHDELLLQVMALLF